MSDLDKSARDAAIEIVKFLDAFISDTEMEQLITIVQSAAHEEFRKGYEAGFRDGRVSAGKPLLIVP